MSYFDELTRFLAQAQTDNLKTSHFEGHYHGLKVKVSFGKGNPARVPWIAFLADGQYINQGIYPFYLFYKNQNLLVLAFGVSEAMSPQSSWQFSDGDRIKSYFKAHELGKPARYGDSFLYRIYDVGNLKREEVEDDLRDILEIYTKTIQESQSGPELVVVPSLNYKSFSQKVNECGLHILADMVVRFIASLLAKPFVILTGLSGSGKTKLAQIFARWISENEDQVCLVAVGADWTNREPLLGYPNALEPGKYVKPDTGVLDLLLQANANPGKPYFLILDEMNLSHVERYFADFLSAMESGEYMQLHAGHPETLDGVPSRLRLPCNLFITGTVNIDETTYMFSPKVLDRANVIEFSINGPEMRLFLESECKPDLGKLMGEGAAMADAFVKMGLNKELKCRFRQQLADELIQFFNALKPAGAEFGYRSATEILRFAAMIDALEPDWSMRKVMDAAIMQKLLPKIHGSRRKLEPVLKTLGRLCLQDPAGLDDYFNFKKELAESGDVHYPMALEKIRRMYKNLVDHGFTSYAEA